MKTIGILILLNLSKLQDDSVQWGPTHRGDSQLSCHCWAHMGDTLERFHRFHGTARKALLSQHRILITHTPSPKVHCVQEYSLCLGL